MAASVKKSRTIPPRKSYISKTYENSNPNVPISTPGRKSKEAYLNSSKKAVKSLKSIISPSPAHQNKFILKKSHTIPLRKSNISKTSENSNPNLPISTPGRKSKAVYLNSSKKTIKSLKSLISPSPGHQNKFIVKKKISLKKTPIRGAPEKNLQIRNSESQFSENRETKSGISETGLLDAPEHGEGRVKYLVEAFERLFMKKDDEICEKTKKDFKFLKSVENFENKADESEICEEQNRDFEFQLQNKADETEISYSGGSGSSERDINANYENISKRESNVSIGSNRTKRNSTESTGPNFTKKPKVTNPNPFLLKTEERGRVKEENFLQKLKEKLLEEERLRVPLAQGLPLTTDEPHYPFKPAIKERTEPFDLILHSDIRAVERAEFDHQVAEKINFIEKIKFERERLLKIEEEEEIKRLRKVSVPKAQPMPKFNKPFLPKKSIKQQTVPKEPKFHVRPPRHNS